MKFISKRFRNSLIVVPKKKSKWDIMRETLERFEEFDMDVKQLKVQERDLF